MKTEVKNDICGSGFGEPGDHQEFTGIPPGGGTQPPEVMLHNTL